MRNLPPSSMHPDKLDSHGDSATVLFVGSLPHSTAYLPVYISPHLRIRAPGDVAANGRTRDLSWIYVIHIIQSEKDRVMAHDDSDRQVHSPCQAKPTRFLLRAAFRQMPAHPSVGR